MSLKSKIPFLGGQDESNTERQFEKNINSENNNRNNTNTNTNTNENNQNSTSDNSQTQDDEDLDTISQRKEYTKPDEITETGDYNKRLIAPQLINEKQSYVKSGQDFARTYFIHKWPDDTDPAFLKDVYLNSGMKNDISIHIDPYDSREALKKLESHVRKINEKIEEGDEISSWRNQKSMMKRKENTEGTYEVVENTDTELFDVGMYVTVRGDTKEELDKNSRSILKNLRVVPSKPYNIVNRQVEAMVSTSPIAKDIINYKTEALGLAIGNMYPFTSKTISEMGGVDFGIHSGNGSPVFIDRFNRNNGYNQFTVGKIGSGKSFSTKLNMLRTYANRDDLLIYMLDPVGGFGEVLEAMGGEQVVVSGQLNINPMEIKETPPEVIENAENINIDPFGQKKKNLMDFFDLYFKMRNEELSDRRGTLEKAIDETYKRKGINKNLETHKKESPTIKDLINTIENMNQNPKEFIHVKTEERIKDIKENTSSLLTSLIMFREGGQFENLAQKTEERARINEENDIVYFDLSEQEGGGGGGFGLMMRTLFFQVYDLAKQTDKKVMFAIDEAHYLLQDKDAVDFLATAVRHSRHIDLAINFITQEINDFFANPKTKAIVKNCSIKLFQRIETELTEEMKETLEMNEMEHQYIRQAKAGDKERGYSEALLGVGDYGYVPIQVRPSNMEQKIIEGAFS